MTKLQWTSDFLKRACLPLLTTVIVVGFLTLDDPPTDFSPQIPVLNSPRPTSIKLETGNDLMRREFNTIFSELLNQIWNEDLLSRREIVREVAEMVSQKPYHREQLLKQLADERELLSLARSSIVEQLASFDPSAGRTFLYEQNFRSEEQRELQHLFARTWSMVEPEAALTWYANQKSEILSPSFGEFVTENETAAIHWLNEQNTDLLNDELFLEAGKGLTESEDYHRAALWIAQVLEPQNRKKAYRDLYESWIEADQEAAQIWEAELGEVDRNFLRGAGR